MNQQKGTIIVICLGWLAILSVLGLSAMRQSLDMIQLTQAQHMTVNTFEAAEAGLVAAQQILSEWHDLPVGCEQVCIVQASEVDFYPYQSNAWWEGVHSEVNQLSWLNAIQVYYVIEYLLSQPDNTDSQLEWQFFRVTSKGLGSHQRASVVLQLTVARSVKNNKNQIQQQKVWADLATMNDDASLITPQAWRQYY